MDHRKKSADDKTKIIRKIFLTEETVKRDPVLYGSEPVVWQGQPVHWDTPINCQKYPVIEEDVFQTTTIASTSEKGKGTGNGMDYESILDVIRHTGCTFEEKPETYAKLEEDELKHLLLSSLNGWPCKGGATGETFRKRGKTDIRIGNKDRSAFVAECKVWRGDSELIKAIDQLLGYLTCRDCVASIIIFNKDAAGFTGIQQKIPGVFKKHPNYLNTINIEHKGEWRFEFRSKDDPEGRVTIHVFMFNLYVGKKR